MKLTGIQLPIKPSEEFKSSKTQSFDGISMAPENPLSRANALSLEKNNLSAKSLFFQKARVHTPLVLRFGEGEEKFDVRGELLHPYIAKAILKALSNAEGMVTIEHVLQALFKDEEAAKELKKLLINKYKIAPNKLQPQLDEIVKEVNNRTKNPNYSTDRKTPLNDADFAEIFKMVLEVAKQSGGNKVDIDLFLKAIFLAENSKAAKMLRSLSALQKIDPASEEDEQSPLEAFTRDITFDYELGEIPPVIGRDLEVRKVINSLALATTPNPILIGDQGVGKTAIVEKVAELLSKGEVPESLLRKDKDGNFVSLNGKNLGKRLLEIHWELIEAKAQTPGEFKGYVEALLNEAMEREGEVILFVDEIHKINEQFSTTRSADQLKPPLARGKIRLIGSTTSNEYRQKFEKDLALVRRFTPVYVNEPSLDQALTMMRGFKNYLAQKHKVTYRDDAIEIAVKKAKRYLPDMKLPASTVRILDMAGALVKNESDIGRFKNHSLKAEITQLDIDIKEGLTHRETQYREDLRSFEKQIEQKTEDLKERLKATIKRAGEAVDPLLVQKLTAKEIDNDTIERSIENSALGQVATNLVEEKLVELAKSSYRDEVKELSNLYKSKDARSKQLDEVKKDITDKKLKIDKLKLALTNEKVLRTVTENDVLRAIEDLSGIPLAKLEEENVDKFLRLEDNLGKNLIGQKKAIAAVAAAIKNNKAGLSDPNKPIGSFLFLGPTGTGKTELAKVLAKELYDDRKAIVRFDMSEFGEKHNVARLIGSPPGYVGYEEGGMLTNAMKDNPRRIVLFDEIEKAHPDIYNVLLQILDEGHLTSGKGERVSFKDSIVILTSNIGSARILTPFKGTDGKIDPESIDFDRRYKDSAKIGKNSLESDPRIKPEFLNRINDVVVFHPLMRKHNEKIVDLKIRDLNEQLKQTEQKVSVKLDESAKQYLVEMGSDFEYGARPLDRFITQSLKKSVATGIMKGEFSPGEEILIDKKTIERWQKEAEEAEKKF